LEIRARKDKKGNIQVDFSGDCAEIICAATALLVSALQRCSPDRIAFAGNKAVAVELLKEMEYKECV